MTLTPSCRRLSTEGEEEVYNVRPAKHHRGEEEEQTRLDAYFLRACPFFVFFLLLDIICLFVSAQTIGQMVMVGFKRIE